MWWREDRERKGRGGGEGGVLGTWVVVVMEGKEGSKGRRIRVGLLLLLKALIRHVLPFAAGKAPAFALEGLALLGGEGQEGSIHLQGRGSRGPGGSSRDSGWEPEGWDGPTPFSWRTAGAGCG